MNIPLKYRPKYIEGYEGKYGVCRAGYVYNFRNWKFRQPVLSSEGYLDVILHKQGKRKKYMVHRLVAQAFIPNPNNLPKIIHKNEVKDDNRVENLMWVTHQQCANYGTRNDRLSILNSSNKNKNIQALQHKIKDLEQELASLKKQLYEELTK